jgi:hypothetical protein
MTGLPPDVKKYDLWGKLSSLMDFLSDLVENEHVFLDAINDIFEGLYYLVLKPKQKLDKPFMEEMFSSARSIKNRKISILKVYKRFWKRITAQTATVLISIPPHHDIVTIRYHSPASFNQEMLSQIIMRVARRDAIQRFWNAYNRSPNHL